MSTKQDRAAPRTASDIERKYNFGKSFAEVFGLAQDAQEAAAEAKTAAGEAQTAVGAIDHEAVFNLLTDNGKIQGIYKGEDGNIYINATYIMAGVLDAAMVTIKNLIAEKLTSKAGGNTLSADGAQLELLTDTIWNVLLCNAYAGMPILYLRNTADGAATDLSELSATHLKLGGTSLMPIIYFSTTNGKAKLWLNGEMNGKELDWKDNGDGTFTLIGT